MSRLYVRLVEIARSLGGSFFSTTFRHGECTWQEGGRFIPGTVNNFGGSSTAEFGHLLASIFPEKGFTTAKLIRNFNSGDMRNPCRA